MYHKLAEDDRGEDKWEDGPECRPRATTRRRISKPLHLIQPSYDCVVIGSGYGGGIAASRMARAGQSVCLLERGAEKWPGEYPETLNQTARELSFEGHVRRAFRKDRKIKCGNASGLYRVVVGEGQTAVVGNGLGGTSLINSNVFLEADAGTLSMDVWPPEIRNNPGVLEPYYQKVRDVLEPQPYPESWPSLKKTELLQRQAERLGLSKRFYRVPQTTRFRPGPNSCGVTMAPSTLSGQDTTGVNDGSKTTTLVTYLSDAWNWGAEIFCRCEVRHVEKAPEERGGYNVYYAWHDGGRDKFQRGGRLKGLLHVHARKAVFLGAGSIGTTEILLRSKAMGLQISDQVGSGMSGNGDMLAFGYNCSQDVNAIGGVAPRTESNKPVGPTINATIDMREATCHPLHGFVIQEGAVPQALARLVQPIADMHKVVDAPEIRLGSRLRKVCRGWKSRLLGPYARSGAVQKTQVFLVMSHDGSHGTMRLENGEPKLQFPTGNGGDRDKEVHTLLSEAVKSVGGTLISNPCSRLWGSHKVTVHPLGGARMSRDNTARNGVTNHRGQVFTGRTASETHPGLIVVDGAVVPAALGVNPLATISALAERAVCEYANAQGLVVSRESNGVLDPSGSPARAGSNGASKSDEARRFSGRNSVRAPSISFTEYMAGFVDASAAVVGSVPDDRACFEACHAAGRDKGQVAQLLLSASLVRRDRNLPGGKRADGYEGSALTGSFVCPTMRGSPFVARNGSLRVFRQDGSVTGTSRLVYDFDMTGADGRVVHFHGYKVVSSSASCDPRQLWRSLTTLYVSITEWNYPDQTVIARGKLSMRPGDFGRQLRSLTASGATCHESKANLARFVLDFVRRSASHLLLPLAPLQYPRPVRPGEFSNPTPPSRTVEVTASDGVRTKMHVWEPSRAVSRVDNLLMIPGAAVSHEIFALPTVAVNAVNFFTAAGFRVFVAVHRIGADPDPVDSARRADRWTTYDARLDIKACMEHIRTFWSDRKLYTVAHCMGSVALASGLLDGTIPAGWILGITCSQVFMNPVWSASNTLKRSAPLPLDRLTSRLLGEWFDCTAVATAPSRRAPALQRLLDLMLRAYPERTGERCRSASCHRTTLLFGRCWNHGNLNEATHRHVDKFFGSASMTLMGLLMRMSGNGVTANAPDRRPLTTPDNIRRLRGIPIFLFSGSDNDVLSPAATERTYEVLTRTFGLSAGRAEGGIQYRREVFAGYGHLDCWMGRRAHRDVFPVVCEEIRRVIGESQ